MQIQVNSDASVVVSEESSTLIQSSVTSDLGRFSGRITRVEVHLSDINGEKFGSADKRCLMEVRPSGREPVAVSADGVTIELAVKDASSKMKRLLGSTFGRWSEKA